MGKSKPVAAGLALGIVFVLAVWSAMIGALIWPGYGAAFLAVVGSIYPWASFTFFGFLLVGVLAFLDGFVCGWLVVWLCEKFQKCDCGCKLPKAKPRRKAPKKKVKRKRRR